MECLENERERELVTVVTTTSAARLAHLSLNSLLPPLLLLRGSLSGLGRINLPARGVCVGSEAAGIDSLIEIVSSISSNSKNFS